MSRRALALQGAAAGAALSLAVLLLRGGMTMQSVREALPLAALAGGVAGHWGLRRAARVPRLPRAVLLGGITGLATAVLVVAGHALAEGVIAAARGHPPLGAIGGALGRSAPYALPALAMAAPVFAALAAANHRRR